MLDGIRFWDRVEWLLEKTFGPRRREDISIHGHSPPWLAQFDRKLGGATAS